MIQDLEQIEYRYGFLGEGMRAKDLPVRVWRGRKIPPELRRGINFENLLNLGGVYGDRGACHPVQYDRIKIILSEDTVEIMVFNRKIALTMSDDECLRSIHRVLSMV